MTDTELGTEFKPARRTSSVRIVTVSASVVDANTPHSSTESCGLESWPESASASPDMTSTLAAVIPAAPTAARSSSQRRVPFGVDASRKARLSASAKDEDERSDTTQASLFLHSSGDASHA